MVRRWRGGFGAFFPSSHEEGCPRKRAGWSGFPSSLEEGCPRKRAGWSGFPSSLEEGWREAPGRLAVCSTTPPAVAGTPPHPRRGKKISLRHGPGSHRDRPGSPGVDAVQVFHTDLARCDFAQCDDRRLVARGLDVRRAALGELARAVRGREGQLEAVGDSL